MAVIQPPPLRIRYLALRRGRALEVFSRVPKLPVNNFIDALWRFGANVRAKQSKAKQSKAHSKVLSKQTFLTKQSKANQKKQKKTKKNKQTHKQTKKNNKTDYHGDMISLRPLAL